MNMLHREKNVVNTGILSATRPTKSILTVQSHQTTQLQTRLSQKKRIVVYVEEQKYYVEHAAAYALGLFSVEDFNNATSNYYYITEPMLENLKNKYDVEMYSLNLSGEMNQIKKLMVILCI